ELTVNTPDVSAMGNTQASGGAIESSLSTPASEAVSFEHSSVITCAYDPNDKQVEPIGFGESHAVDIHTEWLHYIIRFQNTGTDTATNVLITDALDQNLIPSSLQIIGSSHDLSEI